MHFVCGGRAALRGRPGAPAQPPPRLARRHAALPMVCRRWNELCYCPELLGALKVKVDGDLNDDFDSDLGDPNAA